MTTYLTVAIPYVNAAPHLGYAFELVEADLAARARRATGEPVRFLGGTDEYSLKNVLAAEDAGEEVRSFVDRHADRFAALAEPLGITFDDFIRTSRDRRHQPAVERLWRACADAGDLYQQDYTGSYCVGCEQFYEPGGLVDGRCPEHERPVETVSERNWFFRLSRHADRLLRLVETDELRVTPDPFRREILAFLRSGLDDISVSRSAERAHGWGIPVPGDATQVIYVWFDALTNYLSALDFGTDGPAYREWWRDADERIHVVGKGITRFHAVYWPAFLLSAGQPLPTRIQVHPYLTQEGAKLSKSGGAGHSPTDLAEVHGRDALRWWFASEVSATTDTDFSVERLVQRANGDLANGLGNAVARVVGLRGRHDGGRGAAAPLDGVVGLPDRVSAALAGFDRRRAIGLVTAAVDDLNRHIEDRAPWRLARRDDAAEELGSLLATYTATLGSIARAIEPITPELTGRILAALDADGSSVRVFERLA